jgi:transcription elongation factor Elf1
VTGGGEVHEAWACPRCGNADVDSLALLEPGARDAEGLERETVRCGRCGLRYRLP